MSNTHQPEQPLSKSYRASEIDIDDAHRASRKLFDEVHADLLKRAHQKCDSGLVDGVGPAYDLRRGAEHPETLMPSLKERLEKLGLIA